MTRLGEWVMVQCSYCDENAEHVFTMPVGIPTDGSLKDDFTFEIVRFCATHWAKLASAVAEGRQR